MAETGNLTMRLSARVGQPGQQGRFRRVRNGWLVEMGADIDPNGEQFVARDRHELADVILEVTTDVGDETPAERPTPAQYGVLRALASDLVVAWLDLPRRPREDSQYATIETRMRRLQGLLYPDRDEPSAAPSLDTPGAAAPLGCFDERVVREVDSLGPVPRGGGVAAAQEVYYGPPRPPAGYLGHVRLPHEDIPTVPEPAL